MIKLPGFYQDFEARRRDDDDYASATRDVARMLGEFRAQKMDGVVLDLRDNGGGSLSEAVELTGLFIDKGPVVQVRESGGRVSVDSDRTAGVAWDGPLAVLINRGSASASEIVAGAIQDYGRGLIIGETSFGKGTVQNMVDLDRWPANEEARFGQVKLTIAQFFRPGGSSTQNKGVVPDVSFPTSVDASEYGESTYDNALPWTRIAAAAARAVRQLRAAAGPAGCAPRCAFGQGRRVPVVGRGRAHSSARKRRRSRSRSTRPSAAPSATSSTPSASSASKQRKKLGIALDPLLEGRSDDGLQADERNVAESVAREEAAKKVTDPLLRESAAILGDAIGLLGKDAKLAAQVLPEARTSGHWVD